MSDNTASSNALLMRFRATDSPSGISRATLTRLASQLGYERESEVLHYAVRKLAEEVLPKYKQDDGPLTARQIAAIRKAAGPARGKKVSSSLI